MILSTKIRARPKNRQEMIMRDADLEPLGRDYFPYVSELLRIESKKSEEEWLKIQIDFIKIHKYYTESARKLFDRQKQENLSMFLNQKQNK